MSPAIAAKLETWPVPDADDPSEIIKRNSKVLPLSSGNVNKSASGEDVAKPCLARISHLQVCLVLYCSRTEFSLTFLTLLCEKVLIICQSNLGRIMALTLMVFQKVIS